MKMKATLAVEYEAEATATNPEYSLRQALIRAKAALRDSIGQGVKGHGAGTGIKKTSIKIEVVKHEIE